MIDWLGLGTDITLQRARGGVEAYLLSAVATCCGVHLVPPAEALEDQMRQNSYFFYHPELF